MAELARLSLLKSKAFLKDGTTQFDDAYKAIIKAATDLANTYTHRELRLTDYANELYTGNDTNILYLKNYPIVAVNDVYIWDGVDSYDPILTLN